MSEPTTTALPKLRAGMTVQVHQKIQDITPKGEARERNQIFEGIIIKTRGGQASGASFTVRKISNGVGVEKIFPIHLPSIAKIEILKTAKVRHAKIHYVRTSKKQLKYKKSV